MILLDNEQVEQLLTPRDCVEALEIAYREMGRQAAGDRPRTDLYTTTAHPDAFYRLRTMEGAIGSLGVAAIRIGSDIVRWFEENGEIKQQHLPATPDNRWVGLVMLFDVNTSEPLLLFPDGALQRMRVGATSAIAARCLARPDSTVLSVFGSGNQARGVLLATAAVFDLREVRVYSPREENCRRFVEEVEPLAGVPVVPVGNPRQAVQGSDMVACATNSLQPVVRGEWLEPGMHVGTVEWCELDDEAYQKCDPIAVHIRKGEVLNYLAGVPAEKITGLHKHDMEEWMTRLPGLDELLGEQAAGRTSPDQISCFVNNVGSGLQFAAAGKRLYELAQKYDVGRELPREWFTQELPS